MAVVTAPSYRLALPASADWSAWLKKRREGIGSSDVPAIMGVDSRYSAHHVFYDKRGELPLERDAGERARWGHLLEEPIAREWARIEKSTVRRVGLIARKDASRHMCTLDRRVDECPLNRDERERCALEVKNRDKHAVAKKWRKGIPDDVLAQVLWQIHVTGYSHIHVAVLVGGNELRRTTVFRRDHEKTIDDITTVVDALWFDYIVPGRVPPLTGQEPAAGMLDLYGELHPDRSGFADMDDFPMLAVETIERLLAYEEHRLRAKAEADRKAAAHVAMIAALGGKQSAILDGRLAYELRGTSRRVVDWEKLLAEFPGAYEACVTEKPGERLYIAPEHRLKELREPPS